jgi:hypothetical protein
MVKKIYAAFTLFLMACLFISCATTRSNRSREESKVPTYLTIQAEKFPEVLLKERAGINKILKILRLEGEKVVYLPSPYWNVLPEEIALEQISSIEFTEVPKRVGGPIAGFFLGYYVAGLFGLSTAKYNVDYEHAITNSLLGGVACGLLGLVIDAVAHPRPQTKFYFSGMSVAEKVETLKIIMFGY